MKNIARTIQATDSEWAIIRARANAASMNVSAFLMARGILKGHLRKRAAKQASNPSIEKPPISRAEKMIFFDELHNMVHKMTLNHELIDRPRTGITVRTDGVGGHRQLTLSETMTSLHILLQQNEAIRNENRIL